LRNQVGQRLAQDAACDPSVDGQKKSRAEGYARSPVEQAEPALGIGRLAQSILDSHRREETADEQVDHHICEAIKRPEQVIERNDGLVVGQFPYADDHALDRDDRERKRSDPLLDLPDAVESAGLGEGFGEVTAE